MIPRLTLENSAVSMDEVMKLSSNFIDIISDCDGLEDYDLRNAIQNYSPLVDWLLETPFARRLREMSTNPQMLTPSTAEGVEYELKMPGAVWTTDPVNNGADCCWTVPDFAKCRGSVPLYMVCLKDCDKIFDKLIADRLRINERTDLMGVARDGETLDAVNERIRILWFEFYMIHTAILGTSTTSDNLTKPFHGLLECLQDDAVISFAGANPLAAFKSLSCRLDVLGGADDSILACNPLIYRSLQDVIVPDEYNRLPDGWTRDNGTLRFKGLRFIADNRVPVNMTNGTGDIWYLDGRFIGLFLGYSIDRPYIVKDDFSEETKANGCATLCTYLYNFGTVANNDKNRIAVISNVPISSACTEIGDLASIINPQTLIPA